MDSLPFTKMTGAGNDFIVIDNRAGHLQLSAAQIEKLCHRQFGIGADGLLAVESSPDATADYRMRYYNSDGGEAEMCGNGARCFARYIQHYTRAQPEAVRFLTPAGLITGQYRDGAISVNLTAPQEIKIRQRADFGWGEIEYHFMNTGVPHTIVYVPEAETVPIMAHGQAIRQSAIFPRGTNVNFVQVVDPQNLIVRTYERGVENETLACGTGVVAAALLTHLVHRFALPLRVKVRGGDFLAVDAKVHGTGETASFTEVNLTGPAVAVFTGEIRLP